MQPHVSQGLDLDCVVLGSVQECGRAYSTSCITSSLPVGDTNEEEKLCALCGGPWVVMQYFAPAFSETSREPRSDGLISRSSSSSKDASTHSLLAEVAIVFRLSVLIVQADVPRAINMVGEGLRALFSDISYAGPGQPHGSYGRLRQRKVKVPMSPQDGRGFLSVEGYEPHDFATGLIQFNRDCHKVCF